jgi:hypothetical protein
LELAAGKQPKEQQEMSRDGAERYFLRESAVLITLLALNDRAAEANDIANSVLKVSGHPKRNVVIKAAVKGQMPDLDWKTFAK